MAGKDTGEERNIDPTSRRIRQLRKQGQVPASREFVGNIALLILTLYFIFTFDSISFRMRELFEPGLTPGFGDFVSDLNRSLKIVLRLTYELALPPLLIGGFIVIFASILDLRGIPVSMDAVAPKFERLNPIEGFKRLFSLRSLFELLKSLAKIILISFTTFLIVLWLANDLFWAPSCGLDCVLDIAKIIFVFILVVGVLIALISAIIDIPISRFLFSRDNRMTKSELKRDRKEEHGDPAVRSGRRRFRQEIMDSRQTGAGNANFVVTFGDALVALLYVRNDTPAPVVMAKLYGEEAREVLATAKAKKLPIIIDEKMTADLMTYGRVGQYVPKQLFNAIAGHMVKHGIIKPNG